MGFYGNIVKGFFVFKDGAKNSLLRTDRNGNAITAEEIKTNDWIDATITNTDIVINHSNPNEVKPGNLGVAEKTQSPKFGESVKIIQFVKTDAMGHVLDSEEGIITLPEVKINGTSSGVITDISVDNANPGSFTKVSSSVGSLVLDGYQATNKTGAVSASDTINEAFGKLQKEIIDSKIYWNRF